MLDDVPRSTVTSFESWWSGTVFRDNSRGTLSRKDLVLIAANQDGGAHVDPALNEVYARLSQDNAMGWSTSGPDGERPMPRPERAAIRQIAHETLKTLKPGYQKKPAHNAGALFGGMVLKVGPSAAVQRSSTSVAKVGRNDLCLSR